MNASPRGDVRPSAIEEVTFDGTVWDDFGAPAYGLAYSVAGGEPKFIELGHDVAAKEKRSFNHIVNLEQLGAKPDDLISWFVWADDVGPDGKWSAKASALDYEIQFSATNDPDGQWVPGTLVKVFDDGWTNASKADDYVGRWSRM